ncbi:SDR family NAD(P)-dependent oxidoreductase [Sphingomonas sp. SRS2]|uniref:SDR family NAD(P)-dependent oxidoreductase n=1 Tax=Sphingomonas sp. SRS2 TaxID=133190 RepID=UPI0006183EF5|nr:SDR family oxidoreductase [Sphingomonas sp. SRS2]KKC25200.1 hypothetical protein WP12_15065 [Sphingomonas sp. SRS2]
MGRTALIIGGASGIGAAAAAALADGGATIAIADLALDKARVVAARLTGGGHRGYVCDVMNASSIEAAFEAVERDLGPVAVLVVAAGTPGLVDGKRPTLRDTTEADWDQVMALNARGTFLCTREMLRRRALQPVEHGRIVLVASMAAQVLSVNGPPSYVASKGAVLAFTRAAAGEAAALRITVNAVAPGAIATPMLRRLMSPEQDAPYLARSVATRIGEAADIGAAIAYLASPAAEYVNGACLDVNGGMAMR